jgi:hypothetical protein
MDEHRGGMGGGFIVESGDCAVGKGTEDGEGGEDDEGGEGNGGGEGS